MRAGESIEVTGDSFSDITDLKAEQAGGEGDSSLRSILQNDQRAEQEGALLAESFNQGISAFHPDIMFENMTKSFSMAKKLYGETLIKLLSGYNPSFIEKNINIPEFKREFKKKLEETIESLKEKGHLKRDMSVSDQGLKLASMIMLMQELEKMVPRGIQGSKLHKKVSLYGERGESRPYHKGDRYRDIALKESIKLTIRRGKPTLTRDELRTSKRQSKGETEIVYAIDASGSMKGRKIEAAKKAGVALAYQANKERDKVGLIIFGSKIRDEVKPTLDFVQLLQSMTKATASSQTDFMSMLRKATTMFSPGHHTKHFIILTDAMPTVGGDPQREALRGVANLRQGGITISVIGINLDDQARRFAERIVEVGLGRLYAVRHLEDLDTIILEDYYSVV